MLYNWTMQRQRIAKIIGIIFGLLILLVGVFTALRYVPLQPQVNGVDYYSYEELVQQYNVDQPITFGPDFYNKRITYSVAELKKTLLETNNQEPSYLAIVQNCLELFQSRLYSYPGHRADQLSIRHLEYRPALTALEDKPVWTIMVETSETINKQEYNDIVNLTLIVESDDECTIDNEQIRHSLPPDIEQAFMFAVLHDSTVKQRLRWGKYHIDTIYATGDMIKVSFSKKIRKPLLSSPEDISKSFYVELDVRTNKITMNKFTTSLQDIF